MNKLLLLLGATIIYYIVLFYFDNKRRKAFRLAQKKVIGQTTLPDIEKEDTTKLFGNTHLNTTETPKIKSTTLKEELVIGNLASEDSHLEKELEELAIDLEAEQTIEAEQVIEIAKENWLGEIEDINEIDVTKIVTRLSKHKS